MQKKYFINIHTILSNPKVRIWRVYKSGDFPDSMIEWCYAKTIIFKGTAQTCQILDCFYMETNGVPNIELEKDVTYDKIIFKEQI